MKRCFVLFNLMLITGMAYLGVDMFYRLATAGLSTMPMVRVAKKSQPPSRGNAKANISGYRAIVERNLFNTQTGALSGKISESAPLDTLKPTELKLKLFGTVTGNNSGYAVIEDGKTRQQTLYRSGDLVQEALVKKILRDKVVLAVKGKDEILVMEDISNNSANAMAPGRPAAGRLRNIVVNRSQMQEATRDIGNLLRQLQVRPHFSQGRPDGLSVTGIRPDSIFRKMGLRSGDVVTDFNGKAIRSVNDALGLYETIQSSNNITLKILRMGRPETITYTIQ